MTLRRDLFVYFFDLLLLVSCGVSVTETAAAQGSPAMLKTVAAPVQQDRVSTDADLSAKTRLAGHVPTWATPANDEGAIADATPVRLTFVLSRSADLQAAFIQRLADQQNPSSVSFHQWLSPQQVGTLYGPTQHDVETLTTWLTAQGLALVEVAPSRMFVTVEGSAGVVGAALGTSFHSFLVPEPGVVADGSVAQAMTHPAATLDPALPTAFTALVSSISGLSDTMIRPMSHHGTVTPKATEGGQPTFTSSSGSHYVTPGDFATIFDLNPVYQAGITGAGQKVAIIGR